jgi:hypothetical protein
VNSINVNIPVVNLPQVSGLQADTHRMPIAHQAQNSDMNRDRFDMQMRTAREAEAAEGKTVDPKDRREEERHSGKREREKDERGGGRNEEDAEDAAVTMSDNGGLIDLEA